MCLNAGVDCTPEFFDGVSKGEDDHGVAVVEAIKDMAPGAQIYIAKALTVSDYRAVVDWFASAGVTVIPEPFSPVGLAELLQSEAADPSQLPRDPAETKQAAKVAVEWLRRLAVGEVTGYDIRPAGPALRQAMQDDELAENAIEAVAHIPTAEAQQDLLFVALSGTRPVPIRMRAADRVIRHVQQYGKLIPENQTTTLGKLATSEADPDLKARLIVIYHILGTKPGDLGALMLRYPPPLPQSPAPPAPAPPPGAEGKKDESEKK